MPNIRKKLETSFPVFGLFTRAQERFPVVRLVKLVWMRCLGPPGFAKNTGNMRKVQKNKLWAYRCGAALRGWLQKFRELTCSWNELRKWRKKWQSMQSLFWKHRKSSEPIIHQMSSSAVEHHSKGSTSSPRLTVYIKGLRPCRRPLETWKMVFRRFY